MTELRWNPTVEEWVSTATERQNRPLMPSTGCPFCPGSDRVPDHYDVLIYPNDFPAFSIPPPEPSIETDELYRVRKSYGKCDVVLYHPDHNLSLPELSVEHITLLVRLWRTRFGELRRIPGIRYVLIFENKGAAIGVTMPHPHGQIYSFPFIPPRLQKELAAARSHQRRHGRCVYCAVLEKEREDRRRIITENEAFTALIPFYARWPYEVHVFSHRHFGTLEDFTAEEEVALASMLKTVTMSYDRLFNFSFPYMMLLHQAPARPPSPYFHFHIEFYPPYRAKDKLKYMASVETGGGVFLNDSLPEEKAAELRSVHARVASDK